MSAELELLPLSGEPLEAGLHGRAMDQVDREFADERVRLRFTDVRCRPTHGMNMIVTRNMASLSLKQLFAVKWIRMLDYAGLIKPTAGEDYEDFLSFCYVSILNGDDKGEVLLASYAEVSEHPNRAIIGQHCKIYYTANFEDVYLKAALLAKEYLAKYSSTPMAKFARLNVGRMPDDLPESIFTPNRFPCPLRRGISQAALGVTLPIDLQFERQAAARVGKTITPPDEPAPAELVRRPSSLKPKILAELLLTPIHMDKVIPVPLHGQVVQFVENELSSNATTLIYIDDRGAYQFKHIMTLRRAIGTLPARHLFALKWLRMMEFSGVLPDMLKDDYGTFAAQMYAGIMNADSKASVTFEATKQGGSSFENIQQMLQQKCLDYYTPHFDNVFTDTLEMINSLSTLWPDSAMVQFGVRHLNGGSSGWATSR